MRSVSSLRREFSTSRRMWYLGAALVVGALAHRAVHLRRDHHVVALLLEDAGQHLLRSAAHPPVVAQAVDIGAVDQVHSRVDGMLDEPLPLRPGILSSESKSQGNGRHLDTGASEVDVFQDTASSDCPQPAPSKSAPGRMYTELLALQLRPDVRTVTGSAAHEKH